MGANRARTITANHQTPVAPFPDEIQDIIGGTAAVPCLNTRLLGDTTGDTATRPTRKTRLDTHLPRNPDRFRKPVRSQGLREFESRPLRHFPHGAREITRVPCWPIQANQGQIRPGRDTAR